MNGVAPRVNQANILARSSVSLTIDFPKSGWVEQSAQEVWVAARQALDGCLAQGNEHEVVALGISNQRETQGISSTIAWKFDRIQYAYEGNITVTGSGLSWALSLTGFESLEPALKLANE